MLLYFESPNDVKEDLLYAVKFMWMSVTVRFWVHGRGLLVGFNFKQFEGFKWRILEISI